jgi:hypothetical protein
VMTAVQRKVMEREIVSNGGRSPMTEIVEHTYAESHTGGAVILFRRSGEVPWILRETDAKYLSLGSRMRPTSHENFLTTIELLRALSPNATYDDRLAAQRRTPMRLVTTHHLGAPEDQAHAEIDLAAHLVARWVGGGRGGPYRDAPARGQ